MAQATAACDELRRGAFETQKQRMNEVGFTVDAAREVVRWSAFEAAFEGMIKA